MFSPDKLEWLDLSSNYLEKIEPEITQFVNLKSLQLHSNYISNLDECKKLAHLPYLANLTLYGNFIE